jgi:hypothetical protein
MTLTERYLKAVAAQLPKTSRDDIVAELADAIADRMDARVEAVGRPLTDDEQEAVLREVGHPLAVAARYGSGPLHVVGPELFPWWMFGLKVGIFALLALTLLGLVARVLSGDSLAGPAIGHAFSDAFSGAMTLIGFATVAAFIIERQKDQPAFLKTWRVKDLGLFEWAAFDLDALGLRFDGEKPKETPKTGLSAPIWQAKSDNISPVAGAMASAVAWFVFLLWWTGLIPVFEVRPETLTGKVAGADYTAIFSEMAAIAWWPVVLYALGRIAFGIFRALRPDAYRLRGLGDLLLALTRLGFAFWVLTASALSPIIRPLGATDFLQRLQTLFETGQGALPTLLMLVVIISLFTAVSEAFVAAARLIGIRGSGAHRA